MISRELKKMLIIPLSKLLQNKTNCASLRQKIVVVRADSEVAARHGG
jgi:hypothetical protein